jgi:diguanylate cyclase (GGDEF)-like protein
LRGLIPYHSIAVFVYEPKNDCLLPAYVNGENFGRLSSLEIPMGQGLAGWVAENCKPILNGNPSVEPGYRNGPTPAGALRSALAVPLRNDRGITGVLALYHADQEAFNRDHLRVLEAVNTKVSLSIENALQYQQVSGSATTDGLTGLPNARSLFLHLDGEIARAKRIQGAVAVLVCDLEGFQQVNDRFGPAEGDKLLRLVASGFKQSCREYDYVARMGGYEFILVMPGLRACDLADKLSALAKIVLQAGEDVSGQRLLAVSTGAAFFPEDGDDADSLLAAADRRMYLVKRAHKGGELDDGLVALNKHLG